MAIIWRKCIAVHYPVLFLAGYLIVLLMIQNDLLHEFIDKAIVSFWNRFRSCVAATAGHWHWEQTAEWAIGIWQSWLKRLNCWWKAVKILIFFIRDSWIFNVQLHVHLKKWTLKFKLLYLRNYISYFNKICKIRCVNTRIQSLKVWLKSIQPWLKYSFFSRGLFVISAPCSATGMVTVSDKVRISDKYSHSVCQFHHYRVACPWMDVAVSTSNLHAEGLLMENTSANMSLVARQTNMCPFTTTYLFRTLSVASLGHM